MFAITEPTLKTLDVILTFVRQFHTFRGQFDSFEVPTCELNFSYSFRQCTQKETESFLTIQTQMESNGRDREWFSLGIIIIVIVIQSTVTLKVCVWFFFRESLYESFSLYQGGLIQYLHFTDSNRNTFDLVCLSVYVCWFHSLGGEQNKSNVVKPYVQLLEQKI